MPTTAQIKCIRGLLANLKMTAEKDDIVLGFTNGRTNSISQMDSSEVKGLIFYLKSRAGQHITQPTDGMLGAIYSMCHEIGWTKKNDVGVTVADTEKVNQWAIQYGYLHKPIKDYTYEELVKLVTQFKKVLTSFYSKF